MKRRSASLPRGLSLSAEHVGVQAANGETRLTAPQDIAEQAISMARSTTGENRAIAITMPANLPAVSVDPRRLTQALGNLLSNAIKFTPAEGRVAIRAFAGADGGISFVIEDSGIGMAQETIAAALEPFRQLDGSLARKFEGAGLGLPIARALTELHGGSLEITSAVGKGTTAIISLPDARSQRHALSA